MVVRAREAKERMPVELVPHMAISIVEIARFLVFFKLVYGKRISERKPLFGTAFSVDP
ncbi:hypothetical protein D9M70_644710 [compost metagenome]